jgi:vacuolar-type H+-ATPase subunit H
MEKERELWGHRFKIVKNGLDESDVVSYVESIRDGTSEPAPNDDLTQKVERLDSLVSDLADKFGAIASRLESLNITDGSGQVDPDNASRLESLVGEITQRLDLLATGVSQGNVPGSALSPEDVQFDVEKLEHLNSLTRLAERTVVDAEKEAEGIRAEIEQQANENAGRIVAEAEEQARIEADKIMSEARAQADDISRQAREKAERDAQLIKEEADKLVVRSKDLVESEIKGMFDQAYQKLLANFQGSNQTPDASDTAEDAEPVAGDGAPSDVEPPADVPPEATDEQQANASDQTTGDESPLSEEPHDSEDQSSEDSVEDDTQPEQQEGESPDSQDQPQDEAGSDEQPVDSASDESQVEQGKSDSPEHEQPAPQAGDDDGEEPSDPDLYKGTVELAIPPPVGLDQVMQLHKELKQAPEVEVLNFGGSVDRGITIRVVCHAPVRLVEVLSGMPGVQSAIDESQTDGQLVPSRPATNGPKIRRVIATLGK